MSQPLSSRYDFLDFISFPSCFTVENAYGGSYPAWDRLRRITLPQKAEIKVEYMVKTKGLSAEARAYVDFKYVRSDGVTVWWQVGRVYGNLPWTKITESRTISLAPGELWVDFRPVAGGSGTRGVFAETKFDDLKIYQDDKLIYANDFTEPLISLAAGMTPILVVSTVVGARELQRAGVIP